MTTKSELQQALKALEDAKARAKFARAQLKAEALLALRVLKQEETAKRRAEKKAEKLSLSEAVTLAKALLKVHNINLKEVQ